MKNPLKKSSHQRAQSLLSAWIRPVFSEILHLDYTDAAECKRHQHTGDFEIVAVEKGIYTTKLNDNPLTLFSSEILVVKPGDWHEDFFKKGLSFYSIYFHLESSLHIKPALLLFKSGISATEQKLRIPTGQFIPLFERIQEESNRNDTFSANLQDALSAEFFWTLVRALGKHAVSPEIIGLSEEQQFRTNLYQLFHEKVHQPLSIPEMAHILNMSESSLAHRCKTITGLSPAHAFLEFKIHKARLLLETSKLPVKEVSERFGFVSPYHFSHAFKRVIGVAPTLLQN